MQKLAGKPLAKFMQKLFTTPKTQSLAKGLPLGYPGKAPAAVNMVRGGQLAERAKQLVNKPSLQEALKRRVLPYGALGAAGAGAVAAANANIDSNMKKVVDNLDSADNIDASLYKLRTKRIDDALANRNAAAQQIDAGIPRSLFRRADDDPRTNFELAADSWPRDVASKYIRDHAANDEEFQAALHAELGLTYARMPPATRSIPRGGVDPLDDVRGSRGDNILPFTDSPIPYNYKRLSNPLVPANFKQTGLGKFLGGLFAKDRQ